MVYMLAMLALASGMVVLMFGFSSAHSSMYAMQSAIDDHDRVLRGVRQADSDMSSQFKGWQKIVDDMRREQQKQQATLGSEHEFLQKLENGRLDATSQLSQLTDDVDKLGAGAKAAASVQNELKSEGQRQKEANEATAEKLAKVVSTIEQLRANQQTWQLQLDSQQQALDKLASAQEGEKGARERMMNQMLEKLETLRNETLRSRKEPPDSRRRGPGPAAEAPPSPVARRPRGARLERAEWRGQPGRDATEEESPVESDAIQNRSRHADSPSSSEAEQQHPSLEPKVDSLSTKAPWDAPPKKDERTEAAVDESSAQDPSQANVWLKEKHLAVPSSSEAPEVPLVASSRAPAAVPPASTPRASPEEAPEVPHMASSRAPDAVPPASTPRASPEAVHAPQNEAYHLSWYRECGCTGMEIEAVTLLLALVDRLGASRVRSNRCQDTCAWPASTRSVLEKIEVQEDSQLAEKPRTTPGGPSAVVVLVVHIAFNGICSVPDSLLLPRRKEEDPVSESHRGLFRVSRSMIETETLQEEATFECNSQFDAVWVPSQFNVHAFVKAGVNQKLVHALPEAVDPALFNCSEGAPPRQRVHGGFGLPRLDAFLAEDGERTFTFLSIFKWEDRKNWKALLENFALTFPHNQTEVMIEDGRWVNFTVRLLIKTKELSWGTDPAQDLEATLAMAPEILQAKVQGAFHRILIIKDDLPTEAMPRLYRAADAFVLPTHGEGWGLPLIEAMASGLPTIATNWSGQTEFMNSGNSYPLGYVLTQSTNEGGQLWAEPNTTELQQAMWDVLRRPGVVRAKAERACQEVHERYAPE
eukprot:CAMPEP_0168360246 /NCGR_PEP_ID=MMETSP0228-20121227/2064_1 /TAXON_ID=133427 /ORGANISM="Protoceratium reticulatum, Strain CCCM 535 (=CCMP 1889)" /LENGTH=814 /DNA_ID=CAMNT_0008372911 /DNA_START=67 /DNA_END=2509 /DNA_ORIENTATION=-